jgi:hypothetical protein
VNGNGRPTTASAGGPFAFDEAAMPLALYRLTPGRHNLPGISSKPTSETG